MLLGVNIDHIATLRNARGGKEPDLIEAAKVCQKAGANGITVHLREDRRHIKDDDVYTLKKLLEINLNLEMAVTAEMQRIALDILPHSCCIVPEKRQELTTEGGLDVKSQLYKITDFLKPLVKNGILVSLFIDPDKSQVQAAYKTGAQFIELHTGAYSNSFATSNEQLEFEKLKSAAEYARSLGLKVNAGHGLNYENVHRMKEINDLVELNIGHSIVSKSVFVGLAKAVHDMRKLI